MEEDNQGINQQGSDNQGGVPQEATPVPASASGASAPQGAWYDALDEGLRANPAITKHADVNSLASAYAESVRKLSEGGFPKLPANATAEQRSAYNALRRGDDVKSPADYSYAKGEEATNDDLLALKNALFEAGADDYMATQVLSSLQSMNAAEESLFSAEVEKIYAGELDKLREEWGDNFQTNMKATEILLNRYPEAKQILEGCGAQRCASVVLMLHELNAAASDGQIKLEEARTVSLDERLAEIQNSDAYRQAWHPDHQKAVDARMDIIFKKVARMRN